MGTTCLPGKFRGSEKEREEFGFVHKRKRDWARRMWAKEDHHTERG